MESIFSIVYKHPLLTAQQIDSIAQHHKLIKVARNEFLLKEGERAESYYILVEGVVRAFVVNSQGEEITTEFFAQSDIVIIHSSLFQRIASEENLQAVTDCTLYKIEFPDFQKLYHEVEGIREWGRAWFSNQVFTLKKRSLDVVMKTASERYIQLMKEKPQIIKYVPLKQIATYLGITDSSLSRIRRSI